MTEAHYQVHEHFWSIQGEGHNAGQTALFLRLQGCPVGCEWCDAKLTWYAGGDRMTLTDIRCALSAYPSATWLVITGGEPLLYNLDQLLCMAATHFPALRTQVETSGAFAFKGDRRPDWTCLSPKYTRDYTVAENVIAAAAELKYVVDERFVPQVAHDHLAERRNLTNAAPPYVYLMPEGSPPREAMVERTLGFLRQNPLWSFGPRLQYDYAAIRAGEGDTNQPLTQETVRAQSSSRRRSREAV